MEKNAKIYVAGHRGLVGVCYLEEFSRIKDTPIW